MNYKLKFKEMKKAKVLILILFTSFMSQAQMVIDINTNYTGNSYFELPLNGTVDAYVDWGDGNTDHYTTSNVAGHMYMDLGSYTITINGTVTHFGTNGALSVNIESIMGVSSFGDIGITDFSYAFFYAQHLYFLPSSIPTGVTNMAYMFSYAFELNDDINSWDVSTVTNMEGMFDRAFVFNQDLNNWDVSNVTNMAYMFNYASVYNSDLSSWNTSNVTNMAYMFNEASVFNINISNWNVSTVTNMEAMFSNASAFNQDISNWSTNNVANMSYMFNEASAFNNNLSSWNTSSVTNMAYMFNEASVFNTNISNWNVSSVASMEAMFERALAFNQNISNWDVSNVTNMSYMFYNVSTFNSDLSTWSTNNVANMSYMFYNASVFNSDLSSWNTSNVTDMSYMFTGASSFNQNIGIWNVSNVTDMSHMFCSASVFNHNIGSWNMSNVTSTEAMFFNNPIFNQDISTWDVSTVTNTEAMFEGALAFNQDLNNWDVSNVTNTSYMFYNTSVFNSDLSSWNTSNVTDMSYMFTEASVFNTNISNWDVSNVTNMHAMFANTGIFNQDISNWNVSSVIDMQSIFNHALSFNQDIGNWDVSNVTDMNLFLYGVELSIANYNALLIGWSTQSLQPNINFNGGNSEYSCIAENARNILLNAPNNWSISDSGSVGGVTSSTINETTCDSYISPSGNYIWFTNGTYNDTIPNSLGCDSILTINLTVINIDNNVTQDSATFTADATGLEYQWLDCDNGNLPILGAIAQTYIATAFGTYSVKITDGSCVDTSACISFQPDTISIQNPNEYTVANQVASSITDNCSIVYNQIDSASIYNYSYVDVNTTEITIRVYYNSTYTEIVENIYTPVLDVYEVEMIISCSNKNNGSPVLKIIDYIDTGVFTNIDNLSFYNIKLYPNPTTGIIQITGNNIKQVEIFNLYGVLVQSTNNKELDLSNKGKGIYFVKITTPNGITTQKILLE